MKSEQTNARMNDVVWRRLRAKGQAEGGGASIPIALDRGIEGSRELGQTSALHTTTTTDEREFDGESGCRGCPYPRTRFAKRPRDWRAQKE